MIQIRATKPSINAVISLIENKASQVELIVSPIALTEISKSVFTITSKKFLRDLSAEALQNPKKYHHLYEWGSIGSPTKKLFLIKRAKVQYGDLIIDFIPIKSTKPVPIPARLLEPGPTGKVVSAQHIFRSKMEIMEENKPVHIYTKKTIVFSPDGKELVFIPKGHVINIMNPGGQETTHALQKFSNTWFMIKAPMALSQSRLIQQIGNEVSKVVNRKGSTKTQVYETIRRVNSNYSQDLTVI